MMKERAGVKRERGRGQEGREKEGEEKVTPFEEELKEGEVR